MSAFPAGDSPRISVVVATYNYDLYLARALDSILAQQEVDFEVLVVDDGSTDQTREIVGRYGRVVNYVRQEHAGVFSACRTGARAARGRYVLFIDADDRLRPGALAALQAAAERNTDVQLILAGTCAVKRDGRRVDHMPPILSSEPLENFKRFVGGSLRATLAGGLIERSLLFPFDRDSFEYPHGTDRAVLGYALLHPSTAINFVALEVYDHPGRLRENVSSIDQSGLQLAELLFDKRLLPPSALEWRKRFTALLEASRGRAYHRAGWHSKAWRSYFRAAKLAPALLARPSIPRRAAASYMRDRLGAPEGPVRRLSGHWLLGNERELWSDPFDFLRACAGRGPVVRLRLRRTTYLLSDPVDMRHVLISHPDQYHKTGILRAYSLLAGGTIGKDGAEHRGYRRVLQPNFQKRSIEGLAALVMRQVDQQLATWNTTDAVDVLWHSKFLCADLASQIIFGCEDQARTAELIRLLQQTHRSAAAEFRRWLHWPRWIPTRRRRRYAILLRDIDAWLEPFVRAREGKPGADILSAILQSVPAGTPVTALRERLVMLFLAAMEPVGTTLAWALRLLADDPDTQARLFEETCAAERGSGGLRSDGSAPPYATMVLNEVLRLYPNEWLLTRSAVTEDRLPCGVRVRRGEEVMISPYVIQRDARFFSEPDRFDPERFGKPATWPPMTYIPFGAGPRGCLGEFYGRLVITIALNQITRKWRTASAEPLPRLETANLFSAQPKGGRLMLRFFDRVSPKTDQPMV